MPWALGSKRFNIYSWLSQASPFFLKMTVDTKRREMQTGKRLNLACMFSTQRSRRKNEAGSYYWRKVNLIGEYGVCSASVVTPSFISHLLRPAVVLFIFYSLLLYCVCVCFVLPCGKRNCFSARLTVVSFPLYESKCLIETNKPDKELQQNVRECPPDPSSSSGPLLTGAGTLPVLQTIFTTPS